MYIVHCCAKVWNIFTYDFNVIMFYVQTVQYNRISIEPACALRTRLLIDGLLAAMHSSGLLHKTEEETHTNKYMVNEKLPKEIGLKRKAVADLTRVVSEPAMGQADLDAINQKVPGNCIFSIGDFVTTCSVCTVHYLPIICVFVVRSERRTRK